MEENVGTQIRHHRDKLGVTQKDLAHWAGLHHAYISQLERGYKSPTLSTLRRIARALDISPGALIDG